MQAPIWEDTQDVQQAPPAFEETLPHPADDPNNPANRSIGRNALEGAKGIGQFFASLPDRISGTAMDAMDAASGMGTQPLTQDLVGAGNAVYSALPHPTSTTGKMSDFFTGPWDKGEIIKRYEKLGQHPIQSFHDDPIGSTLDASALVPVLGAGAEMASNAGLIADADGVARAAALKGLSGEAAELPVVAERAATGAPHAVYSHAWQLSKDIPANPYFKVFGDSAKLSELGTATGSDLPLSAIQEKGIPIAGKLPTVTETPPDVLSAYRQSLPSAPEAAPGVSGRLRDFANEQRVKAIGGKAQDFAPDQIEQTQAMGQMLKDKGIVGPISSNQKMWNRLSDAEKQAISDINEPAQRLDAAGIKASSGQDLAQQIQDQLFSQNFGHLPETVQAQLKAGIPTGSNYDLIAQKIRQAANNAALFGQEPMTFDSQQALKRFQQGVGNFDSEARALKIPKAASGIVRKDLESNVQVGADLLGDPGLASNYKAANQQYGMIQDAQDLLGSRIGKAETGSAMGPADVGASVVGGVLGGAPGAAAAYGVKQVGKSFGNQLAASGADVVAYTLERTPQLLGKFAAPLQAAKARGGNALAVTDFLLQQRDPEYRQMLSELSSGSNAAQ